MCSIKIKRKRKGNPKLRYPSFSHGIKRKRSVKDIEDSLKLNGQFPIMRRKHHLGPKAAHTHPPHLKPNRACSQGSSY